MIILRIIVFGVGKFFSSRKNEFKRLSNDDVLVAYVDNKYVNDTMIDGVPAISPEKCVYLNFDYIIIMSTYIDEIRNQLQKLGVSDKKIYTWIKYVAHKNNGLIKKNFTSLPGRKKKILIVTVYVDYNGGSIAAINAAMALRSRGYNTWIIATQIVPELKQNLLVKGISVAECSELPYTSEKVKQWVGNFDVIIVNTFQNIHTVYELSKFKPVVWWLHEPKRFSSLYDDTFSLFPAYRENLNIDTVNVVAVSDNAKRNFQSYYPKIKVRIMPYGLSDDRALANSEKQKMIFAIIGYVSLLKGHDILVEAIKKLTAEEQDKAEFWLVGSIDGEFARNLLRVTEQISSIIVKGLVNRSQMKEILAKLDVVVSASREDSLPIVITEGMMNSKACIMSNAIGNVRYVTDLKNGLIFQSENVDDLSNKIRWCLNNKEKVKMIGQEARKIYEKEFSMEAFADRLEGEITQAEELFYGKR